MWNNYRKYFIFFILGISVGSTSSFLVNNFIIFLKEKGISNSYIGILYSLRLLTVVKFLWIPLIVWFNNVFFPKATNNTKFTLIFNHFLFGITIILLSIFDITDNKILLFILVMFLVIFILNIGMLIAPLRIDSFEKREQNLGVFIERVGSKFGFVITGILMLLVLDYLCTHFNICHKKKWILVYLALALFIFIISFACMLTKDIQFSNTNRVFRTLYAEYFHKIKKFFSYKKNLIIFCLFFFFKIGTAMIWLFVLPFFMELKFSYTEIALAVQFSGFIGATISHFIIYFVIQKVDFFIILVLFTIFQLVVPVLFSIQYNLGANLTFACFVVFVFYFIQECVSSIKYVYIAKLSKGFEDIYFCNAFFQSLFLTGQILVASFAGFIIDSLGWLKLFYISIVLGLMPIFILAYIYYKKIDIYSVKI